MDESNPYILEIKTVQSSAFRILIEALKDILTDANFEINESGIKIIAMDVSHTVLVHLKLEAKNFEHFYCENNIVLGIGMINFFKLIKTLGNSDTLTLFVERSNINKLGIKIENSDKNSVTTFRLNLMDLPQEMISVPPAVFNSIITLPSNYFQKICRDMYNIADTIEIKSIDSQLIFSCSGDFASQETRMGETNTGLSFIKSGDPSDIVQGYFSLKNLILFTKCTNLCNSIELYLKNNYPLIIVYNIASLGSIRLCLAPQEK